MKIVTWNVNSINARLPIVTEWLKTIQPNVVLLQETKCVSENFPYEAIEDLGYNIAVVGQKSYNGVAILAKHPIEDVLDHLPGDPEDTQARYIEGIVENVRVASIYVPNGTELGSKKFDYKLSFLKRLQGHAQHLLTHNEAFVLGGDYNIAPTDADVYDPQKWAGKLHCSLEERQHLRSILHLGLNDVTRAIHPESTPKGQEMYSWWDYRSRSWQNNNGLRIDLLLASPQAIDRIEDSDIDTSVRGLPKASDHAPVWCSLF